MADALIGEGAARRVADAREMASMVLDWLRDEPSRLQAGRRGRQLVSGNRGSTERILERLARDIG